mmetsp:Transcript_3284/g.7088  ORF Transcript_3284/g.7088 Transcript_3284/m.7088 type:complete len:88 (-) Transcript_3284:1115-1378(-)
MVQATNVQQLQRMLFLKPILQHQPTNRSIHQLIQFIFDGYRPPRINHRAPSYAENRLPLTKNARAMLALDPAYKPAIPRFWISSLKT